MFFLIMGCTTAGLKSSGTAAVRKEAFMIYRTVGPTDLMSTISSVKNLRKFSQVTADSAKPAATGGLTPVFILLKKIPDLCDCV